jgi:tetraacyldisaccharide-1-P 4'-kinase
MKATSIAWSEQARLALEAPFSQRGIGWQILLPLLIPVAVLYSLVMSMRRFLLQTGIRFRAADFTDLTLSSDIEAIIAIGNLAVGGSGKSPLVRQLVHSYMLQGYPVCVLSRGYGAPSGKQGVYLYSPDSSLTPDEKMSGSSLSYSDLADELRELVVSMRLRSIGDEVSAGADLPQLLIGQDPNRLNALSMCLQLYRNSGIRPRDRVIAKQTQGKGLVVLLDDGLQHLRCPRDLEVCIWPFLSAVHAPRITLPVGYYREGLGSGLNRIARTFPVHVWNGAPSSGCGAALQRIGPFGGDALHFGMHMRLRWIDSDLVPIVPAKLLNQRTVLIVTGIAAPHRFVESVNAELSNGGPPSNVNSQRTVCVHFRDHGEFDEQTVRQALGSEGSERAEFVLFVTLKDWCRWSGKREFIDFVARGTLVISVVQAELQSFLSGGDLGGNGFADVVLQRAKHARKKRLGELPNLRGA